MENGKGGFVSNQGNLDGLGQEGTKQFTGDVGIGPTSPPQGIAGQKPMGPVTDYGHGSSGSGLPPQYRKKANISGGGADL